MFVPIHDHEYIPIFAIDSYKTTPVCYIYLSIYMRVQHSHKICYLLQIRYSFHVGEYSNKVKRSKRRSVNRSFYRRRELFHVDNTVEQVETFRIWSSVIERNVFTTYALLFSLICCSLSNSRIHGTYFNILTRLIVRTLITHFQNACTLFSVPSTIAWL